LLLSILLKQRTTFGILFLIPGLHLASIASVGLFYIGIVQTTYYAKFLNARIGLTYFDICLHCDELPPKLCKKAHSLPMPRM